MAITVIQEISAVPMSVPSGEERISPACIAEGGRAAVGDVSGGAVTIKARVSNAIQRFGDLYWVLLDWFFNVGDSNAQNISVMVPHNNYERFIALGTTFELYFAAGVDSGTQIIAPNPAARSKSYYLGALQDSMTTVEVQFASNLNTNTSVYSARCMLVGYEKQPLIPIVGGL